MKTLEELKQDWLSFFQDKSNPMPEREPLALRQKYTSYLTKGLSHPRAIEKIRLEEENGEHFAMILDAQFYARKEYYKERMI